MICGDGAHDDDSDDHVMMKRRQIFMSLKWIMTMDYNIGMMMTKTLTMAMMMMLLIIQHKISRVCPRLLESTAPARQEVTASSLSSAFPYSSLEKRPDFSSKFLSLSLPFFVLNPTFFIDPFDIIFTILLYTGRPACSHFYSWC